MGTANDEIDVEDIDCHTHVVSKSAKYLQNLCQVSLLTFIVTGFLNQTWKSQNVCWINTGGIVGHWPLYDQCKSAKLSHLQYISDGDSVVLICSYTARACVE